MLRRNADRHHDSDSSHPVLSPESPQYRTERARRDHHHGSNRVRTQATSRGLTLRTPGREKSHAGSDLIWDTPATNTALANRVQAAGDRCPGARTSLRPTLFIIAAGHVPQFDPAIARMEDGCNRSWNLPNSTPPAPDNRCLHNGSSHTKAYSESRPKAWCWFRNFSTLPPSKGTTPICWSTSNWQETGAPLRFPSGQR